ncbi:hypothetical protein JKP88DRAFT_353920 [Tribonema minus]|uniref:Uncharacterized protein n=1 Tax=Tribonema minus TaxID=303371 RepID=A0A835Z555_9STRA|nr:hypothetical protein JKP88DRAFT_353920 [Tribonema minus]
MLPLNLLLAPPGSKGQQFHVTDGMRERAILCVDALVHACGDAFVEGANAANLTALFTTLTVLLTSSSPAMRAMGTESEARVPVPSLTGAEEALQLACMRCLATLFEAPSAHRPTSQKALCRQRWGAMSQSLSSAAGGGLLAQLTQLLLEQCQEGRSTDTRLTALRALGGMLKFAPDRALWRRFLPGVFSGLYKTIRGITAGGPGALTSTPSALPSALPQGHGVTVRGLEVVVLLLITTFRRPEDARRQRPTHELQQQAVGAALQQLQCMAQREAAAAGDPAPDDAHHQQQQQQQQRDATQEHPWELEAAPKLQALLLPLLEFCRRHGSWRVRAALAQQACQLLCEWVARAPAEPVLGPLVKAPLQAVLGLLWDEMPQVGEAAQEGIARYRQLLPTEAWLDVRASLHAEAAAVADALPSLARSAASERHLAAQLNLLSGYLTVLGEEVGESHWQHLLRQLCRVLVFDEGSAGVQLLVARRTASVAQDPTALAPTPYFRKTLTYCRQDATLAAVQRTLHLLAQCGDPWLLSDALTEGLEAAHPGAHAARQEQQQWLSSLLPLAYAVNEGLAGLGWSVSAQTAVGAAVRCEGSAGEGAGGRGANGEREHGSSADRAGDGGASFRAQNGAQCNSDGSAQHKGSSAQRQLLPEGMAEVMVQAVLQSDAWRARTGAAPAAVSLSVTNNNAATAAAAAAAAQQHMASSVMDSAAALISLLMEVIGSVAEAAGVDAFEPLLIDLLYPLLDKLADAHATVRRGALSTLLRIAAALGHASLRDMLCANIDYIVDSVIARLRETRSGSSGSGSAGEEAERAHTVVTCLLEHLGESTATPLVRDLAAAVLANVDARWWDEGAAESSLAVMRAIANSIDTSRVAQLLMDLGDATDLPESYPLPGTGGSGGDAGSYEALVEEEEGEDAFEREERANKAAQDSAEVAVLREILERAQYFAATPRLRCQALAAAAVGDCLAKLAATRVDTVLLPAVHRAWPSLMARFREQARAAGAALGSGGKGAVEAAEMEGVAQRRAALLSVARAVAALTDLCGDFLSLKVTEELWPVLRALLARRLPVLLKAPAAAASATAKTAGSSGSSGRDAFGLLGSQYGGSGVLSVTDIAGAARALELGASAGTAALIASNTDAHDRERRAAADQSMDVKVAVALLECLTALARTRDCRRYMAPLAQDVAAVTLPGLSARAPVTLRAATIELFRALMALDGDGLWVILLQHCRGEGPVESMAPPPPLDGLPRARPVGGANSGRAGDFEASAVQLLRELECMEEE